MDDEQHLQKEKEDEDAQTKFNRLRKIYEIEAEKDIANMITIFNCAQDFLSLGISLSEQNKLVTLEKVGCLPFAIQIFEDLARRGYRNQACLLNVAKCYFYMGEFSKCEESIQKCLKLDPFDDETVKFRKELHKRVQKESNQFVVWGCVTLGVIAAALSAVIVYRRHRSG
eukprot:TRINITY_DN7833_c0_g1_i1.p1 TRINITY_DN7833_c0_g1~~TRINITY_DN7833_c0_g1_i1.p1  ORF type:complete len:178 (+),score=22.93 TRINITY_DN7833_c0_g1_i1:25-534(+)